MDFRKKKVEKLLHLKYNYFILCKTKIQLFRNTSGGGFRIRQKEKRKI